MGAAADLAVAVGLLIAGVLCLIRLGFRLGDRPEEAALAELQPQTEPRGALVTVVNPGYAPVLIGLRIRPRGLRVRLAGSYVRVSRAGRTVDALPTAQGAIGVVGPRACVQVLVPADPGIGRKAELVATIGQQTRLRVSSRQLTLSPPACRRPAAHPAGTRE